MTDSDPPLALVAELTHRCPLRCAYCANPLRLEPAGRELDTDDWKRVFDEAASLGVLQLHLSGGEPLARSDLPLLIGHAVGRGLYTNLITSGVGLTPSVLDALLAACLDHVQLSFQDVDPAGAEHLSGLPGGQRRKREAARMIAAAGLPLTANFVIHRGNIDRVASMIALGEEIGASRIEIAHVQYHGWALINRDALLPDATQVERANEAVAAATAALQGRIAIDYVAADYHAVRPKACMGGWARRTVTITPAGIALPCHAGESLGLSFPSVRTATLEAIWRDDLAFARFRGTGWMREPCRSCPQALIDWGGCRCQALALTRDPEATDPVCALSPHHHLVHALVAHAGGTSARKLSYRRHAAAGWREANSAGHSSAIKR